MRDIGAVGKCHDLLLWELRTFLFRFGRLAPVVRSASFFGLQTSHVVDSQHSLDVIASSIIIQYIH